MKRKIWEKDDYFVIVPTGRIDMDPATVQLPEGKIPITWQYSDQTILGVVNDVKLEAGEIVGEVEWTTAMMTDEMYEEMDKAIELRLGGYYNGIEFSKDRKQVLSAELKSVSVIYRDHTAGANPRTVL